MLVSLGLSLAMPLHLFLISYAVLGPLHYLTELNWLHDKKYFTQKPFDYLILIALALSFFIPLNFSRTPLMFALLTLGAVTAWSHHWAHRAGLAALLAVLWWILTHTTSQATLNMWLGMMVPTLIHVSLFTGLYMLWGTLKAPSPSAWGSVACFLLCPLIILLGQQIPVALLAENLQGHYISEGRGFFNLSLEILNRFFGIDTWALTTMEKEFLVFNSLNGVTVLRFMAFAYTYHYLNWFSKTNVIGWSQTTGTRMVIIVILWIASVSLYAYDFLLGLRWLFGLSFLHVILEFPLNFQSIKSILSASNR